MAQVDKATINPWIQIKADVNKLHETFNKHQKIVLTDEKCNRVRTYFQKAINHAKSLQNQIRNSGIVASISLIVGMITYNFSKNRPYLNKFSTATMALGIFALIWFMIRYIDRQDLQKQFSDSLPLSDQSKGKDQAVLDEQLKKVADAISKGCDPAYSLAKSCDGQTYSMLGACIKKGSLRSAILVALLSDKGSLKKHAKESFIYMRPDLLEGPGRKAPKASLLLEQFGATIESSDIKLLEKAAARLNDVAIKELIYRGVKKGGTAGKKAPIEYAIDAASSNKGKMKSILEAFGAWQYANHTSASDLAKYLNGEGLRISKNYAQKIIASAA